MTQDDLAARSPKGTAGCRPARNPRLLPRTFAVSRPRLLGIKAATALPSMQDPTRALAGGPSGFTCLHAATLVDASRLVAPLVAAGLSPDVQIEALDGPAAFGLRHFLRDRSQGRLPSSRLCAVFRGEAVGHCGTVAMPQCLRQRRRSRQAQPEAVAVLPPYAPASPAACVR